MWSYNLTVPDVRFCEWSQAAWELQKQRLLREEGSDQWDIHFLGVYHDGEGHLMDANKDLITGRAMAQWWDKADESGPPTRVSEAFALERPALDCLAISDQMVKPLVGTQHVLHVHMISKHAMAKDEH